MFKSMSPEMRIDVPVFPVYFSDGVTLRACVIWGGVYYDVLGCGRFLFPERLADYTFKYG